MTHPVVLPGEAVAYKTEEEADKAMRKHLKEVKKRERKYLHQTK